MKARRRPRRESAAVQRGQSLLIAVLLLAVGVGVLVYNLASPAAVENEKDRITAAALAQAKAALIGYAAGVSDLAGGDRPGDLPCPDLNDSGSPLATGIANCNTQATRIGRLPWKTLGLQDLRDGDGERLWYAVSDNFKDNVRTACASPGVAGCLNSDARGTITVRDRDGTVINNGNDAYGSYNPSGVIAVIFAPGAVLQRQDTGTLQDRSCTGGSCTTAGVCTSSPVTNTPKCNPVNYLDIQTGVEDNASFTDSSSTDGFINGVIRDTGGNVVVNDRLITITYADLMPVLQKRVAREVTSCLDLYAATVQNNGRYPWAAPIADTTSPYGDQVDVRFGRIADTFTATLLGLGLTVTAPICALTPALCMSNNWPGGCGITQGNWWTNWKEMVFYGVAKGYQPGDSLLGVPAPPGCGGTCSGEPCCLTVDPPLPTANKRYVVVVAGRRLSAVSGGQPRASAANKGFPGNYLEDANGDPGAPYTSQNLYTDQSATTTYNDVILYR